MPQLEPAPDVQITRKCLFSQHSGLYARQRWKCNVIIEGHHVN